MIGMAGKTWARTVETPNATWSSILLPNLRASRGVMTRMFSATLRRATETVEIKSLLHVIRPEGSLLLLYQTGVLHG